MSGREAREPGAYPGVLAALMAAVRPGFRGEVLGFDPRDPVFGGPPCLVDGCERPGRNRRLCVWHYRPVVRTETGLRAVRRHGRPRMAAAVNAGGLPGSRMRVRKPGTGPLRRTLQTLPARRPAGYQRLDRGRAARDPAGSPGHLPGPRLRAMGLARVPCSATRTRPPGSCTIARTLPNSRPTTATRRNSAATASACGACPRSCRLEWQYAFQCPQRRRTAEGGPGRGPAGGQLHRRRRRHVPAGLGRGPVAAAQAAARPAGHVRDHAPVADHLCPPAGRGTGLRPRLGRGIPP